MRNSTSTSSTALAGLVIAVSLLTGCTSTVDAEADSTPSAAPEATTPSPSTPSAGSQPTPVPTPDIVTVGEPDWYLKSRQPDGRCITERLGGAHTDPDLVDSPRRVDEFMVPILTDGGPREYAQGEVILNDDGSLAAYVVASGDTPFAVAERFCSREAELARLNAVRRNTFYSSPGEPTPDWITFYAGDTINLDPATITTVGDEQGEVFSNEPELDLPPQR